LVDSVSNFLYKLEDYISLNIIQFLRFIGLRQFKRINKNAPEGAFFMADDPQKISYLVNLSTSLPGAT